MGISLPPLTTNPGVANQGGMYTPIADAGNAFIQALLQSRSLKGQESRSSAELDIQKQHLALLMAQEKTKQAELAHQTEVEAQKGTATQLFLEHALPHMAATGGLSQMLGTDPTRIAAAAGIDAAPKALDMQSAQAYQKYIKGMDPEALVDFFKKVVPVLQEAKRQQQRDEIDGRFPSKPNETTEQTMSRLRNMTAAYANVGDHQMVASLAESIGALKPTKTDYEWFQKPDGSTVYLPAAEGSKLKLQKPTAASGFGFGAGGPVGVMRALSAVAGMKTADQMMKPFELQVASKQANLTDFDYFRGQLATLYNGVSKESGIAGHLVPFFGTEAGAAVLARLNRTNPDLANYLQAASQWALEESALSNRPSDFRTKMDEFVSSIKPDAKVQSIHNLWQSRAVRLNGFQRGVPALQRLLDRAAGMGANPAPGTTIVVPEP